MLGNLKLLVSPYTYVCPILIYKLKFYFQAAIAPNL